MDGLFIGAGRVVQDVGSLVMGGVSATKGIDRTANGSMFVTALGRHEKGGEAVGFSLLCGWPFRRLDRADSGWRIAAGAMMDSGGR